MATVSHHAGGAGEMPGVSKGQGDAVWAAFVELIGRYVEENQVEKPDDWCDESVGEQSGNKVYIIQNTDKKVSLETIAQQGLADG